jgi:GntR family transcriptional repressor for pyruvate dehydrogenase complex
MVKPILVSTLVGAPARRSRGEPVLERLRREILLGRYAPGDRLPPERELSSRLGTNRNTLRESLRTLESENLLRARQGDGTIVLDWRASGEINLLPSFLSEETPPEERLDAITTLFELRTLLVDQVIELAVTRGQMDDWLAVEAALEELRALPSGSPAAAADVEVFRRITRASHNLLIVWVFNTFAKIFIELGRRFPLLWTTDEAYVAALGRVLDHLRAGRGPRARREMARLFDERAGDVMVKLRSLTGRAEPAPARRRRARRRP